MKIDAYYMFDTAKDAPFQILLENPDDPSDLRVAAGVFLYNSHELFVAWPRTTSRLDAVCDHCEKGEPDCAVEDGASDSTPTPMHLRCIPAAFGDAGYLIATELVNFKSA